MESHAFTSWDLLGRLPFALTIAAVHWASLRRGWPWRSALLATGALVAGLSLGALLLPSVLGAMAGGAVLWLLAQRVLRLRSPPLFTLAVSLAALLAVGRVGCHLAGCCFGTPTDLPWAIHYGEGSAAFLLHQGLGWLGPGAHSSLSVHPTQLYESLALACWLPVLFALRRRSCSEGTLLCATAAFDLGLRGLVDGHRAMLNVWWATQLSLGGVDLFRLSLLAAALLLAALALQTERVARRRAGSAWLSNPVTEATEALPGAQWLVYLSLCALALATDRGQTPILRWSLLLALLLTAPALRLPALDVSRLRALPAWSGPALAMSLLLPLVLRAPASAQSSVAPPSGERTFADSRAARRWLYQVDHQRGLLVRLGSALDPPAEVERLRLRLGLDEPPLAEPPLPPQHLITAADVEAATTVWLTVGGALGSDRQSTCVSNTCSGCNGTYQVLDRSANTGWLKAEARLPASPGGSYWLGGRAGFHSEAVELSGPITGRDTLSGPFLQAWVELEGENVTLGLSAMAANLDATSTRATAGTRTTNNWLVLPGGHLRVGTGAIGLDLGFLDRSTSGGGLPFAHVGLSGRARGAGQFFRPGFLAYHLDFQLANGLYNFWDGSKDTKAGLSPMLGAGFEVAFTDRFALGLDAAIPKAQGSVHLTFLLGGK